MIYKPQTWEAREGTDLNRFTKSGETAGEVLLTNAPTTITNAGTPITVDALNRIEEGIRLNNYDFRKTIGEIDFDINNPSLTIPHLPDDNIFRYDSKGLIRFFTTYSGNGVYYGPYYPGALDLIYTPTCLSIVSDDDVYIAVSDETTNGGIYKQIGGSPGSIAATNASAISPYWSHIIETKNGDIYALDRLNGGVYKQTNKVGNFVLLQAADSCTDMICSEDGNVYVIMDTGDGFPGVYRQTAGAGSFDLVGDQIDPSTSVFNGVCQLPNSKYIYVLTTDFDVPNSKLTGRFDIIDDETGFMATNFTHPREIYDTISDEPPITDEYKFTISGNGTMILFTTDGENRYTLLGTQILRVPVNDITELLIKRDNGLTDINEIYYKNKYDWLTTNSPIKNITHMFARSVDGIRTVLFPMNTSMTLSGANDKTLDMANGGIVARKIVTTNASEFVTETSVLGTTSSIININTTTTNAGDSYVSFKNGSTPVYKWYLGNNNTIAGDNRFVLYSSTDAEMLNIAQTGVITLKGTTLNLSPSTAIALNNNVSVTGTKTFTVGTGASTFGGTVSFNGGATFNSNVSIANTRTFTVGTGNAAFNGSTFFNADTYIVGSATFNVGTGTATFGGNVSFTGAGTFTTGTGNITINGNITIPTKTLTTSGSNIFNGFTKLGASGVGIKHKVFTGTTANNIETLITHGLGDDGSKIIGLSVRIVYAGNPTEFRFGPFDSSGTAPFVYGPTIIIPTDNTAYKGKPYYIVVTYIA